jgi:hypothetical protein
MSSEAQPKPVRRVRFRMEEVETSSLPVSESAFLLWVLVFLLLVWFGIGVVLGAF